MGQAGVTLLIWSEAAERYGLPISDVERAVPMAAITSVPNATPGMLGVINIGGEVVPVVSLTEFLRGVPAAPVSPAQFLLVSRSGKRKLALVAQEVMGVLKVGSDRLVQPEVIAPSLSRISAVLKDPEGLVLVPDLECIFSGGPERPFHSGLLAVA